MTEEANESISVIKDTIW